MDEPKFKHGDTVRYKTGDDIMRVAYGPLEPVRYHLGTPVFAPGEYCYVVDSGPTHRNVVSEDMLVRAEEWVDCPGKHRVTASKSTRYNSMERLVGSDT